MFAEAGGLTLGAGAVTAPAALDAAAEPAPLTGAAEAEAEGVGGASESSPRSPGLRQMITAMPQAVTIRSIAMNATSFCFADGPRGRMTIVGVLARRGFTGRSGMRIVMCPRPEGGNGCGVNGCDATCGPELGWAGATPCGPDGACAAGT